MRPIPAWSAGAQVFRTRPSLVVAVTLSVALVALTGVSTAEGAVSSPFAPTMTQTLAPGIGFATGTARTHGSRIQAIQVATIDPRDPHVRIRALLSNDLVIKTERPSLLADRKSQPGSLAMVATNGDVSVAG